MIEFVCSVCHQESHVSVDSHVWTFHDRAICNYCANLLRDTPGSAYMEPRAAIAALGEPTPQGLLDRRLAEKRADRDRQLLAVWGEVIDEASRRADITLRLEAQLGR